MHRHAIRSATAPSRQLGRAILALGLAFAASAGVAQDGSPAPAAPATADDAAELAKELAKPVATLISVPMKLAWDTDIGPEEAARLTFIVQPVIPFSTGSKWNLITRTIIPYVDAGSPIAGGSDESGLSDITQITPDHQGTPR